MLHEQPDVVWDWKTKMTILIGIANGMNYLHRRNPVIIHRDLKSFNILIAENWSAKLADFGGSRYDEDVFTRPFLPPPPPPVNP